MNVSFAIQSHPARAALSVALGVRIGGDVDVVSDPDPEGRRSPLRTFRRLLDTTPGWATHRAQVQDDAIVCDGFRSAVEAAVEARPDRILVFYVGGRPHRYARAILEACRRGDSWVVLDRDNWVPVIATCWPVALAEDFAEFVELQRWPEQFTGDDEAVGRFAAAARVRPLASVPSLVEHDEAVPSLWRAGKMQRPPDPGRLAACWIGDGPGLAAAVDWTLGPG